MFDDNPAMGGIEANYYTYQGEMLRGKPSGKGKIIYKDNLVFEGQFLNSKKHGSGVFRRTAAPNASGNASLQLTGDISKDLASLLQGLGQGGLGLSLSEDQRYIHGVKDGIFCTTHPDGRKFYEVYVKNKKEHCTKRVFSNGMWGYHDNENDVHQGNDIIVTQDEKIVTIAKYIGGNEVLTSDYFQITT